MNMQKTKVKANIIESWQAHLRAELIIWNERGQQCSPWRMYELLKAHTKTFSPSPAQYETMMKMVAEELEI
jgi:hypothetical protein